MTAPAIAVIVLVAGAAIVLDVVALLQLRRENREWARKLDGGSPARRNATHDVRRSHGSAAGDVSREIRQPPDSAKRAGGLSPSGTVAVLPPSGTVIVLPPDADDWGFPAWWQE